MRSPVPPPGRRGGSSFAAAGRQTTLTAHQVAPPMTTSTKSPKAGVANTSSSEKETPTVVLTAMTKNISPYNLLSTNCDDTNHPSSSLKKNEHEDEDGKGGRITVMERKCNNGKFTQLSNYASMKKNIHHDEESLEGGDNMQDSSGEEEDDSLDSMLEEESIITAIQTLLQCGIASICRLRKIFPASFFTVLDMGGTSVTQFNVEYIEQALRRSVGGYSNDEEFEYNEEDDDLEDRSMNAFTQKSISPLTGASQWPTQYDAEASQRGTNAPPDFGDDVDALKKWQKQAMEALTLVKWMSNTTCFLSEGKLARIIFGICDGDELIESYSFQLSFAEQSQAHEIHKTQLEDSTGVFFQALNGFNPHGTLLPSKTQTSFASQGFTQASSQYFSNTDTMSQKHSQSVRLTQQRSIVMSLSQSVRSIRASAKNARAYQIPESRYLSLDVKFTDEIEVDNLPDVFQEQEDDTTSPFPAEDHLNDQFVVTPIGTISEGCLSGVKVDLHAYSKSNGHNEEDDEDKSVYFTQHSRSCPDQMIDAECSAASNSETSGSEDSDNIVYAIPKGLTGEDVYLPCRNLGHRKSTVNGKRKEEFKLEFDDKLLISKGMRKQWVKERHVLSSNEVYSIIKEAINERRRDHDREGANIFALDEESIAKELKLPLNVVKDFVQRANKRKKNQSTIVTKKKQKRG
jgi:hypothetical protein